MILFRVDGNKHIGSGHIMRCLSIAQKARERGLDCRFCLADDTFQAYIEENGFPCHVLGSCYDHMSEELPKIEKLLSLLLPQLIIADSYFVTKEYLECLRQYAKVVYIDDLAKRSYPVDAVINYNIYASQEAYERLYEGYKIRPRFLLGARFAPLRKEFEFCPQKESVVEVKNVFISTGGADGEHVALRLVKSLLDKPKPNKIFHFIIGGLNEDFSQIKELADQGKGIMLHHQVKDISRLMHTCDVAISASGSTLYELCACAVPTICYAVADNQKQGNEDFCDLGLMLSAGDVRNNEHFFADLWILFDKICMDQALREGMAKQMRSMIDGKGTDRITQEMIKLIR